MNLLEEEFYFQDQDQSLIEFEKKVKLYYQQLKNIVQDIPIKHIILLNNQEQQIETDHLSNSNYPKTRSKGQCDLPKSVFEMEEINKNKPKHQKTKFRHRKNIRKTPQQEDIQIVRQMLNIHAKKQDTITKQNTYFSDQETQAENNQKSKEEFTVFQELEKNQKEQLRNKIEGQQTKRKENKKEKKLQQRNQTVKRQQEEVSQQSEYVPQNSRGLTLKQRNEEYDYYVSDDKSMNTLRYESSNTIQQQQKVDNGPKEILNKHNLPRIFEQVSLHLDRVRYEAEQGQDLFHEELFHRIREQLCYREKNQRSSHPLMKGRLFVVRRIMEIYAGVPPKHHQNSEKYIRNRLTVKDRQIFEKAGLPCPPCRPTTGFLQKLFQNKEFAIFFVDYVNSDKVEQILYEKSEYELSFFKSLYKKVSKSKAKIEEKIDDIYAQPLPLSHLEIRLLVAETKAICQRYCKMDRKQ